MPVWTGREIKRLRELYPKATIEELLAEYPGRKLTAIRGQASSLKIRRRPPPDYTGAAIPIVEELKALRRAKGFSQSSLADAMGRNRALIVRWEKGRHAPRADDLALWAAIVGKRVTLTDA